jgi:hypothetical protein
MHWVLHFVMRLILQMAVRLILHEFRSDFWVFVGFIVEFGCEGVKWYFPY